MKERDWLLEARETRDEARRIAADHVDLEEQRDPFLYQVECQNHLLMSISASLIAIAEHVSGPPIG